MNTAQYNKTVMEHFERPRNAAFGRSSAAKQAVVGQGGAVSSGVWMAFELEMDGQLIGQARFRAYGCPHSIALASWLTERLVGEKLDSKYTLDQQEIVSVLDLPVEKMRSVLVAEDALRACADQLNSKEAC